MNIFFLPLVHWSHILSNSDILITMSSPAYPAAPSPAWPRWILCEEGGLFYICVGLIMFSCILESLHFIGECVLDLYVFTSVYFLWTRYEIIHLCVAFVSVFFFRSQNTSSPLASSFSKNCLSHPRTLVSNPFHGRGLYFNALTSIHSGAFTSLAALQELWGRELFMACMDWLCFQAVYNPLSV